MVDGSGEMVGYTLGGGDSPHRLASYEFHRRRYLSDDDCRALDRPERGAA
jgi:hypothetical protein